MLRLNKIIVNCLVVLFTLLYYQGYSQGANKIDQKFYLVNEAYKVAKDLFAQGKKNYNILKRKSLNAINTFLDLVRNVNDMMEKELRSSIVKFYKVKYLNDFTNYAISMEEIVDIVEHCLIEPVEKITEIRSNFLSILKNFHDVRNFNTVDKCLKDLPDEVQAAHCILHQAVLFNETMQDSLVTILKMKTKQQAQDMNITMFNVQSCLNHMVPKFFDQLLLDYYTNQCGLLKVINASITDLMRDKWRLNETHFERKWNPVVKMLKKKSQLPLQTIQDPLLLTLIEANLSSIDVLRTLNSTH